MTFRSLMELTIEFNYLQSDRNASKREVIFMIYHKITAATE